MAPDSPVIWERKGGVGWVWFNRPSVRNAINQAARQGLADAFGAFEDDDEVNLVVLTGTGKAFCAGVDLRETSAGNDRAPLDLGDPVSAPLDRSSKPIMAAVNGPAVGGGFELALAADLRVASSSAFFELSEVRLGSLPGSGATQRLFSAVPTAVAWRMLLGAKRMAATDAERYGLVSDVFSDGTFTKETESLAAEIAKAAPLSLRAAKLAGRAAQGDGATGRTLERVLWRMLSATEDRAEGRAAFREKRPPRYRGR